MSCEQYEPLVHNNVIFEYKNEVEKCMFHPSSTAINLAILSYQLISYVADVTYYLYYLEVSILVCLRILILIITFMQLVRTSRRSGLS